MKDGKTVAMKVLRVHTTLRATGVAALIAMTLVAPVHAAAPQATASRGAQTTAPPPTGPTSSGIIFVDVTPDTITTLRTAQNLITRIAFPSDAKQAICGDLFDPATNTGSFVIDHNGTDVFIKPVTSKGQTNLFVKTDQATYNFDLVVVPAAQAYRVVNVNLPPFQKQIDDQKAALSKEMEQTRADLEAEYEQKYQDRVKQLEAQSATDVATETKKIRAEGDRRAADMAQRRFVDGMLQGFTTVPLREKRGQSDQLEVAVDDVAYIFEGRLYVRMRVTNRGQKDVTYQEPKIIVQGPGQKDQTVATTLFTSRGDYKILAGQSVGIVAVFERPSLEKGERVVLFMRGDQKDRLLALRLIEPLQT